MFAYVRVCFMQNGVDFGCEVTVDSQSLEGVDYTQVGGYIPSFNNRCSYRDDITVSALEFLSYFLIWDVPKIRMTDLNSQKEDSFNKITF